MKTRLFSLWLLLSVAVGLSAYDFMVDGLCYNITSSTAPYTVEVTYEYEQYPNGAIYRSMTTANIPESVTCNNRVYRVTSIGDSAFYYCTKLASITIPNSVTSIGISAFLGCMGLTSITIPNGVTSIGKSAFSECTGLTSITIPNGVTSIGESAFYECRGLTSITIGNSVTSIGEFAFKRCSRLTSIIWNAKACSDFISNNTPFYRNSNFDLRSQITSFVFGDSVQYIPTSLCNGLRNLTSITIPNSVTSIGESAFDGCTGLTTITIGNSVTYLSGFSGCTSLTSVTIPNSVTSIGNYAFSGCTGLTSVTIGNSVKSIGKQVFRGCSSLTSIIWNAKNCNDFSSENTPFYNGHYASDNFDIRPQITSFVFGDSVQHIPNGLCSGMSNLTSITIPSSVTSIGDYAFKDCTGLTSITIPNRVTYLSGFSGCIGLTSVTIPSSVTSIGKSAFSHCTGLTYVTIPNSVTSIGGSAFYGCTGLTSVTIGNSVTSIGDYAFEDCSSLTSIAIPDSVTSIGKSAFSHCTGLTYVTIPNSVTSIGDNVFKGCSSITSVVWNAKNYKGGNAPFHDGSSPVSTQIASLIFGDSVQHIPDYLCANMVNIPSITIPNRVTSIGNSAFSSCTGLTSITIQNCVMSIGNSAFSSCTALTSVSIGSGVTNIGESAFSDCSSITSITIPNGVKRIESSTFSGCKGLASVTIPDSVTGIGNNAFSGCSGLTSITIPNNVTSIGGSAFNNCTGLTSITIPNGVTSIGSSAFSSCTGLTSVVIGNGVTSIEDNAFSGCKNVEVVVFGSNVETIGASAFAGCQSIYEMTIYATKVPTIQENTFTEVGTGATLRVPAGCAKKYKAHPYWGVFNIEEMLSEHTITVTCDSQQGQVSGSGTYTDGSEVTLTAVPNKGYAFTQWSDGNKDNPRTVTVTADATYTAEFALQNYVVTATCDPQHGQVTGGGTYPYGSEVTLTATANKGYAFTQWSDGNKENPRKVTVTADATYTAEFALQNYVVTATCDPQQGQVTGGGTYPHGSEVTITATANTGYEFTQWSDGNKDNPRTVTVAADATYTAEFALQTYVVTATCDPQQGQVTGGGTYPYGSEVTLTAVPNDGYQFKQWSDGSIANPYSFSVEKDVNIEALFEPTTPVENVAAEESNAPRKVFRDGQVYILRNGKTYTLTGVEVK